MLKLEDFKIKEIETLDRITGGYPGPSIWGTTTYVNFLGWVIETGSQGDGCSSCDNHGQQ